jgi:hypothetical protein
MSKMIGEKVAELSGRTTARRVLSGETQPAMEVSFEQMGKVLGVDVTDVGTYTAKFEPDGYLHGHGQGIGMTKDGDHVTWKGDGVGRFTGKGIQYRGSIFYKTTSQKLAKLNGRCFVFEYDVAGAFVRPLNQREATHLR